MACTYFDFEKELTDIFTVIDSVDCEEGTWDEFEIHHNGKAVFLGRAVWYEDLILIHDSDYPANVMHGI
jgi:hypothetical protein